MTERIDVDAPLVTQGGEVRGAGWFNGVLYCYGGCGLRYADFPCDLSLPTALWNRIAVGPPFNETQADVEREGRGGVLCSACIVKRLAVLPECSVVFADICETDYQTFDRRVRRVMEICALDFSGAVAFIRETAQTFHGFEQVKGRCEVAEERVKALEAAMLACTEERDRLKKVVWHLNEAMLVGPADDVLISRRHTAEALKRAEAAESLVAARAAEIAQVREDMNESVELLDCYGQTLDETANDAFVIEARDKLHDVADRLALLLSHDEQRTEPTT